MFELNLERVRDNAKKASTEELLDRVTVFRNGMEPAAIQIIEVELLGRGVTDDMILRHAQRRDETVQRPDGTSVKCSHCNKPAVSCGWGWHRLFGKIPLFPRWTARCEDHMPGGRQS
jgi:hypothetical protein